MTRLPIRWRVTAALGAALLLVLAVAGTGVYLRLDAELNQGIDRALLARAAALEASQQTVPRLSRGSEPALEQDENPAQLRDAAGHVVASTVPADQPLLDHDQFLAARTRTIVFSQRDGNGVDESIRVLARPVTIAGRAYVLVVGDSLDEKRETLSSLLTIGSIGLTAALLVAAWAGYLVIGLALRPVEAMRRQAEAISGVPDRRLPVPAADDEIGRLGTTLNAMLDRIERARQAEQDLLERERRFIADASHELRTPLTVLRSEIDVALIGDRDAAELHAALESAAVETGRVCRLADDLLTLAQVDNREPHWQNLDVAALIEAVAERHRRQATLLGRRIRTGCAPGLHADLDPGQIERALTNLLDNALRHGAGDVLCTATTTDGGDLQLNVRDHGPGFPTSFQEHAFLRFSRAAPGRHGPGAGLGLAIVQAIARSHHGHAATRPRAHGADVQITVPRSQLAPGRTDPEPQRA